MYLWGSKIYAPPFFVMKELTSYFLYFLSQAVCPFIVRILFYNYAVSLQCAAFEFLLYYLFCWNTNEHRRRVLTKKWRFFFSNTFVKKQAIFLFVGSNYKKMILFSPCIMMLFFFRRYCRA